MYNVNMYKFNHRNTLRFAKTAAEPQTCIDLKKLNENLQWKKNEINYTFLAAPPLKRNFSPSH